jgi:hypothetical protein
MATFEPFQLRSALDLTPDAAKITALAAHGAKLYVGLNDGTINLYSVKDPFAPRIETQLKSSVTVTKGRAIEKLGVLPNSDILGVLCDSIVSLYDLDGEVGVFSLTASQSQKQVVAQLSLSNHKEALVLQLQRSKQRISLDIFRVENRLTTAQGEIDGDKRVDDVCSNFRCRRIIELFLAGSRMSPEN